MAVEGALEPVKTLCKEIEANKVFRNLERTMGLRVLGRVVFDGMTKELTLYYADDECKLYFVTLYDTRTDREIVMSTDSMSIIDVINKAKENSTVDRRLFDRLLEEVKRNIAVNLAEGDEFSDAVAELAELVARVRESPDLCTVQDDISVYRLGPVYVVTVYRPRLEVEVVLSTHTDPIKAVEKAEIDMLGRADGEERAKLERVFRELKEKLRRARTG